jgi:hypothetical protein
LHLNPNVTGFVVVIVLARSSASLCSLRILYVACDMASVDSMASYELFISERTRLVNTLPL